MDSYCIRKIVPDDMTGLVALCQKHAAHEETSFDPKNKAEALKKRLFDSESEIQCLVVVQADELVGYTTYFKQFSTWDADFYLYLDCLYLETRMRGHGIGKELMLLVKQYGQQAGCIGMQWQTPNFNVDAMKFYQNLGASSKTKERFFW